MSATENTTAEPNVITQTFPVTGMSCAACAASVDSMLQTHPGVAEAAVNFASHTAKVTYNPAVTNPAALQKTIRSIGYDLLIEESENTAEALEIRKKAHYQELKFKTIGAIALSFPVAIIGMFFHHIPFANWIMLAFTLPVVFIFGRHFFVNAFKQLKHKQTSMDTLVALSTGIAFLFSAFNTIYPQFFASRGLTPHVYYEAAAVIIAFILLGKLLEERATARTSGAIKKLMGMQPKTVVVWRNNTEQEIKIEDVVLGDVILIRPGQQIPVDGNVLDGSSYIDECMITGEPVPVAKLTDDKVFAGTINQKGSLRITAQKIGSETLLAQIVKMVQEAQGSKAPVQKLTDKIASIFVPVVVVIAILTFLAWYFLGGSDAVTDGLLSMITVLIIACPCALGLATPTAIMVGIGKGAENGILIKNAESLEKMRKINALILDKTGTITQGKPEVTEIVWADNLPEKAVLEQILVTLESKSEHPLAEAVVRYLPKSEAKNSPELTDFESLTGRGVKATYQQKNYLIGNRQLMQENDIFIPGNFANLTQEMEAKAQTVVYFSEGNQAVALIGIADKIKNTSAAAIKALQQEGIAVYMLTGDNRHTAAAIARQVGIHDFKAEVMPADKGDFVKQLQQEGKLVAMVGDGINDSQALALADVGIAMGRGTDIAMDVADITLMHSDLMHLVTALRLSRQTVKVIWQNLFWAFIYNIIGIPIAAGLLYPLWEFRLDPMMAGAAMALSSVSVVTNSLRLRFVK